jgi:hypothetical protein
MARPVAKSPGGGHMVAGHHTGTKQRCKGTCTVKPHQPGLGRVGQFSAAGTPQPVHWQPEAA